MTGPGDIVKEMDALAPWYHRVELPDGSHTPGTRDQSLVFSLYADRLPQDMTGMSVLDFGANAAGLTVEFAKRGADVVAVELVDRYLKQAELVLRELNLQDRVQLVHSDVFGAAQMTRTFDIVCFVGLSYHLRYPQLAFDMIGRFCSGLLLTSSQTIGGEVLQMSNRARSVKERRPGQLYGYEPTEQLFLDMIGHAGFRNAEIVSTAPHPGESAPERICGNRSYAIADAPEQHQLLPFVDAEFIGKAEGSESLRTGINSFSSLR